MKSELSSPPPRSPRPRWAAAQLRERCLEPIAWFGAALFRFFASGFVAAGWPHTGIPGAPQLPAPPLPPRWRRAVRAGLGDIEALLAEAARESR